jgi:hypothetical protein
MTRAKCQVNHIPVSYSLAAQIAILEHAKTGTYVLVFCHIITMNPSEQLRPLVQNVEAQNVA